jgi:ribosomal protein S18 acetylase RimI-like enzyme
LADAEEATDPWERANAAREGRQADVREDDAAVEMLRTRLGAKGTVFIVLTKGKDIVGTALGEAARTEGGSGDVIPGHAHVALVAVDPAEWGKGLGAILLRRLTDLLSAAGYTAADLSVLVGNRRAASLYTACGWVPTDEPYPHPQTGCLLQRYAVSLDRP